jgi:hypothetical protein
MNPVIFDFWQNCNDIEKMKEARLELATELNIGLTRALAHFAEYELLCMRTGLPYDLHLEKLNKDMVTYYG